MGSFSRRKLVLGAAALLVLGVALAGWSVQAAVRYNARDLAGPPPSSLDRYFPPIAPAPLYLVDMFNLAGPFEAIGVHTQEGDMQFVKPSFEAFKTQYDTVSKLVPEWRKSFPDDVVKNLGDAVNSGNPARIGRAMGAVGQVCSDCHLVYQVKVQQKYHWRDFDSVRIIEPIHSDNLSFGDYMTLMAGAFEGAIADFQVGLSEKAGANFDAFQKEFKTLADDACKQCHTDPVTGQPIPRNYYVDAGSMALVGNLGQAITSSNATGVTQWSGAIGNSICFNCHLVHMPAQNAKDIWEQFDKILK
jgi:cytochrome c556